MFRTIFTTLWPLWNLEVFGTEMAVLAETLSYENLDNQCRDPMNNNKDCRVGQLTTRTVDNAMLHIFMKFKVRKFHKTIYRGHHNFNINITQTHLKWLLPLFSLLSLYMQILQTPTTTLSAVEKMIAVGCWRNISSSRKSHPGISFH